ncbi:MULTISPECIES: IMP dehydrogenase [Oceanotoga]|jgi:IMP dehydrogenase|uniref:Inosine-5'-monophosphate dehydrogenase n=1 Tax=Oceanotoga teriensis TaxID=515440 RepID=A0AA45C928_9BACT|nr:MULTISPECIES: IMP dehydrogenase [Oceanotoga]MDN5341627.1 dehydrogenase [Oceanotoga sp.]MDO7977170.1 IMP dehydrogenase [Oceanotoga teriensis]PWJ96559.1 inosine-5'-monophosphate dehydrogenase [Oceanotoga teriensis]
MREALTFDDVLLVPKYSEVIPTQTNTKSRLVKNIFLNVPFISAAMDTVTETRMAKAMAREGGAGVIHKNMSIEEQAYKVSKVKRAENGVITDPITITPETKIYEAEKIMEEYKIGGLPVIDKNEKLLGIITNRDIRFERNSDKLAKELMTPYKDLVVAGPHTEIEKAKEILHENKIEKLPIVDKHNRIIGLITIKDVMSVVEKPNASRDTKGRLIVGAAIGTGDGIERAKKLIEANVDFLVLDSAHGHSKNIINILKTIKSDYPEMPIIAGNIATAQAAEDLIKAGADGVKVGIGPGSICTTRIVAGIGVPQLTAIMDVYSVTKKYDIPLIADGGLRFSGDIVKAFAAGASTVMMGSILAGTDEAPGETIIYSGRKFKTYRGMGSIGAMEKGSKDRYFQDSVTDSEKLVPEGVEGMVAYKGGVSDVIHQLLGGLKAGMGYCGAKNFEMLRNNSEFIKISNAAMSESHAHDIKITKESPNYYFSSK